MPGALFLFLKAHITPLNMLDFSSCCFVALRLSHKWNIAHAEGGAKRAEDPGNLRCHLVCADKIVPHSTTI